MVRQFVQVMDSGVKPLFRQHVNMDYVKVQVREPLFRQHVNTTIVEIIERKHLVVVFYFKHQFVVTINALQYLQHT